jgi:hypothetical protein
MGSVHKPRSSGLPRKCPRASIQASGNPNTRASAVLDSDAISDSRRASRAVRLLMVLPNLPYGVWVIRPSNGSTKNSTVTTARAPMARFEGYLSRSTVTAPKT